MNTLNLIKEFLIVHFNKEKTSTKNKLQKIILKEKIDIFQKTITLKKKFNTWKAKI